MGRSYIETFFRHRWLLTLPLVLGFVLGTTFAINQPREYMATTSVWADTVPEGSALPTTGGDAPPSASQSSLLTQMLSTRIFLTAVAENSPLGQEFKQAGPAGTDAILGRLEKSVVIATPGPQLMTVSVTMLDEAEAKGVATALLEQFERFQMTEMQRRAQAQADFDRSQLDSATDALREAEEALAKVSPSSTPEARADDPAAAAAVAGVELAQKAYADAASAYGNSSRALAATATTGLRILDKPDRAYPQGQKKATLMMGAVAGVLAGATLSVFALLLIMARDKTIREEEDAARTLGLDVVGAIPFTAAAARSPGSVFSRTTAAGERA